MATIKVEVDGGVSNVLKFQKAISDKLFFAPATLYVVFTFLRFFVTDNNLYFSVTFFLVLYGFMLALFSLLRLPSLAFIFLFFMVVSSFLAMIFGENNVLESFVFLVSNFGFATAFLFSYEKSKKFSFVVLGFLIWFSAYALAGLEAEKFFRVSRNFISIFLLLILSIYYIFCWRDNRKPTLFIPFIIFVLSVWAGGRSGIAVSFFVFASSLFFIEKRNSKKLLIILMGLSSLVCLMLFFESIISLDLAFERFSRLGLDSVRWDINRVYYNEAFNNIKNLMFGVPLEEINLISSLGSNPHNSFIALHLNYGLLGFVFVITLLLITIVFLFYNKLWIVIIVFVACISRSFFDISAFYGPLDPIVYSIFFIFIYFKFFEERNSRHR